MSEDVTIHRDIQSAEVVQRAPTEVGVTLDRAEIDVSIDRVSEIIISYQGRPGPPGQDGIGLTHKTHTQTSESTEWIFNHNLNRRPLVQVFSTGGREVLTDVLHVSDNQCRIYFAQPMVGSARAI